MEPIEERYVDKSAWPRGEWDDEPDRVEWRHNGPPRLACLIVRASTTGALCGYVGVPPGHPYHGKGYSDVEQAVRCHGGLTYSNRCQADGKICHVPLLGESGDAWWLGFDCAHFGDTMPAYEHSWREESDSYCSIDFVKREVEQLAAQLCRVAKGLSPIESKE